MKRVKLFADVNFNGCQHTEIVEVEDDTTDKELQEMADLHLENLFSPESWFQRLPDDGDDED